MDKIHLETSVENLPLVGPALTKAFRNIGVLTVKDLLYYFPVRYMDYRKKVAIAQIEEGATVTVVGRVKTIRSNFGFRSRLSYAEAVLEDGTGTVKAIWFNQSYIAKQIAVGDELILSGKVGRYKTLQFTNPAYEKLNDPDSETLHTGRLVPVYRRAEAVPLRTLRRIIKSCLPAADDLTDFIPKDLRTKQRLLPLTTAIRDLHFPETNEMITQARFRLAVDDVLPQQLAAQMRKAVYAHAKGYKVKISINQVKAFLTTLPFSLTASQKRAAWDIFQDLEAGRPMNRLLQGDVGSGKTIVAILAALQAAGNQKQTVLLAPTEILAKQHYDTFGSILGSNAGLVLLTRTFALSEPAGTKAVILKQIKSGEARIIIGTHALLQEKIAFKDLALVVIDEQHRFGVSQRGFLFQNRGKTPHLLSMSATPIPRTLAMSLYGDLAVSTLNQVHGRKPVITKVVPEQERDQAYQFIRQEISQGRQAFVVTPRVEETDSSEVRSVKKEFNRLQAEVFPKFKLGLLYGKMKGTDKEKVMMDFAGGKLDILVTTSVIEIGIDIPNATTMIIEGSERFGLAQLHQLRGRIGRNDYQCYCFLFTTEPSHQDTKRLQALVKITDGFALAELDLAERGFGDLFGKQQSGFMFKYPQFITVQALLTGREIAEQLFSDPEISQSISPTLTDLAEQYLEGIHSE